MQKIVNFLTILVALISPLYASDEVKLESITVISATKSKQSIQDVTSNISVITSMELEQQHYTTVSEALSGLAGISFTNNGGLGKATSVFVRGFDSKRVLVLIDGVRYNDITGLSGAPFEHLMIGDIEQIEVVKGAQSGVWGADATAGVINIITKSAKKGIYSSANVEYGSFNTKKYGALASYKSDDYYVKVGANRVESDGFSAQAPRGDDISMYEDDGYKNTTANIKLGYSITDTDKIDVSHTYIDAYNEYDGYNDPDGELYSKTKDNFTKINFNHVDSFNELDIYASRSSFNRDYPLGWTKEYDGEVYEYGAKSNIGYRENDFLIVGGDYKTFEHKNSIDKSYVNRSVFMTNSNVLNGRSGKIIATESIRYDDYDTFADKTTAKFGLKHYIKDIVTSVNYGTAYNVPTLYNLYNPTYGNINLKPESTRSFDATVKYEVLSFTYFSSKIDDMIDWDGVYNNIAGTSNIRGIEIEYSDKINDVLLVKANYTLLDAKDNEGKNLKRRAKESVNLSLDYYGVQDLHLGAIAHYVGERYNLDDNQGAQTGKYTIINLVGNYEVNDNFTIFAKVDNLTDKYYQVVDGYATAPRSMYAGMKASF